MFQQLTRHLSEAAGQNQWPAGLEAVLEELATTAAIIAGEVRKGAMEVHLRGQAGHRNVHGEEVQKLDEWSNDLLIKRLGDCGHVAVMGSEENDDPIPVPPEKQGAFIVMFDPLDGSSNIDVNATIGTIFSIHYAPDYQGGADELLLRGRDQVAAGYTTYGSSTMFVYTARNGVHGFTLDPKTDGFIQTHADIKIPANGKIYSINDGNYRLWHDNQKALIDGYRNNQQDPPQTYSMRYIGSLVADFHRTLLKGGIFMYPADVKNARGKLRYLYEAAPLALVCEEAGGGAADGAQRILDILPEELHQRTPLFIGSRTMVDNAVSALAGHAKG